MRCIDADAMIDEYGEWYAEEGTEEGYIGTIKGIVDSMPTIEPETEEEAYERGYTAGQMAQCKTERWIPVSERLPDKADFYLTSSKSKQYPDDPYEVYTHISFYACGEWACTNRTVTAWMFLPEPYREEGEQDG